MITNKALESLVLPCVLSSHKQLPSFATSFPSRRFDLIQFIRNSTVKQESLKIVQKHARRTRAAAETARPAA